MYFIVDVTDNTFLCPLPSTCSSYSACDPCDNTEGLCNCGTGSFFNLTANACEDCDENCYACEGSSTYCTQCFRPHPLLTDENVCEECPDGTFDNFFSCGNCHVSCLTCSGAGDNKCLTCHPGFYLEGSSCVACDTSCETCDSPASDSCLTCYSGFYLDGSSCMECHESCKECDGPSESDCTSCFSPTPHLNSGSCETCPDGEFDNGFDACESCGGTCVPQADRDSLVNLYNSLGGIDWVLQDNWLVGDPCSNHWYGLSCYPDGTIFILELVDDLVGAIPADFSLSTVDKM